MLISHFSIPELVEFRKFKVVVIIWLACSAITDVIIAIALVWHLVSGPILLGRVGKYLDDSVCSYRGDRELALPLLMMSSTAL